MGNAKLMSAQQDGVGRMLVAANSGDRSGETITPSAPARIMST
jgi:hypothetical protein